MSTSPDSLITDLYERYSPVIRRAAMRCGLSIDDASDIVQIVFLRLLAAGPDTWHRRLSAGYFAEAGRRASLDCIASRATARTRLNLIKEASAESPERADIAVEQSELRKRIHVEIDGLPERCALAIRLCYLRGLTHEEAAAAMGVKAKAVEKSISRGKRLLRRRLNVYEESRE